MAAIQAIFGLTLHAGWNISVSTFCCLYHDPVEGAISWRASRPLRQNHICVLTGASVKDPQYPKLKKVIDDLPPHKKEYLKSYLKQCEEGE